ncbi:MAG: hypothetical protein HKN68_18955 [Saprospiraceae bacterium]|nr:hypothetical protein [Saprospiraceae bacterium]
MVTNLNKYINHLLYTKGSVTLKGIGTISMERIPSVVTPNKKEILPPKTKFSFSETEVNPNQITEALVASEVISKESALAVEKEYCQEILNLLINYNIVKVSDVGFLEKENSNITFTPSQQSLDQAYYGLPILPLNHVSKSTAIIPEASTAVLSNKPADDEYEWLTYLASLLLGAFMILAYHYFVDPFPYSLYQEDSKETAEAVKVLADEQSNNDVADFNDDQLNTEPREEEKLNDSITAEEEVVNPIFENTEDSSEVVLAKPSAETDCVIIIGVFTNTINALELTDRLKEDGYNSYMENINDSQRVGLSFKCADYDLKEMINQIRKKYNRKAWYLVPQISI